MFCSPVLLLFIQGLILLYRECAHNMKRKQQHTSISQGNCNIVPSFFACVATSKKYSHSLCCCHSSFLYQIIMSSPQKNMDAKQALPIPDDNLKSVPPLEEPTNASVVQPSPVNPKKRTLLPSCPQPGRVKQADYTKKINATLLLEALSFTNRQGF